MVAKDEEFLKRLRVTFRIEAEEHVRAMSALLVELEKGPVAERFVDLVETIYREAHSLKGAARSAGMRDIESLCQPLEEVFSALKQRTIEVSPQLLNLFHQVVDAVAGLLSPANDAPSPSERTRIRVLRQQLHESAQGAIPHGETVTQEPTVTTVTAENESSRPSTPSLSIPPAPDTGAPTGPRDTVRIPAGKLDSLLLQAEELASLKTAAAQRVKDIEEVGRTLALLQADTASSRGRASGAERFRPTEWRGRYERRLSVLEGLINAMAQALRQDSRSIKGLLDEHLETAKDTVMLPVSSLFEILPKVARDLAYDQGKEVEVAVIGAELEIDKRVLDELKDPLLHLIRNGVDHGIGKPEDRARLNKAPRGALTITVAANDSRRVEILMADDGVGIDPGQVRAAAVKAGVISSETAQALGPEDSLQLIFQSGVSTSRIITDISGRGLGLAIVQEKVEKLGGVVTVESTPGQGTAFRLLLPLTLATFRGVLVNVDEHTFVLPTASIKRVLRLKSSDVKTVENRETVEVDGQILMMVRLGDALSLPRRVNTTPAARDPSNPASEYVPIVILAHAGKHIAFRVGGILDEQQVMVKSLGRQLRRVRNIAGATVLANGAVAPVLNVADLMKSAVGAARGDGDPARLEDAPSRGAHILIAEDSITSRTLLKTIVEMAGYQVTTAVDGADAFLKARDGDFNLVVSDVDMPRMSGFELTENIRADKRLSELPVILVTALESREDRERGIDAGASAYIVKSSFDQSNLLEVIQRLL